MDDIEFNESIVTKANFTTTKKNDSLSDNISLFQAIHVLQSKEEDDEDENKDETKAGKFLMNKFLTESILIIIILLITIIYLKLLVYIPFIFRIS